MAPLTEPKQERAVRTRQIVLRAAAEVFDEYGYGGASISKIMQRAGVTQGGMYFHFKSKLGLAEAVMASQQDFIELPPGEDGLQRLIDITAHITHELQHNVLFRASVRLAVEQEEFGRNDDTAYQEWAERFRVQLVAARRRGELLDDVDEDDLYDRPFSITASGSLIMVRDKRWLMVAGQTIAVLVAGVGMDLKVPYALCFSLIALSAWLNGG